MKKVKILFWIVLLYTSTIGAKGNLTVSTPNDSTYFADVVKLLHDFELVSEKLEKEQHYSDSLLTYANELEYRLRAVKSQLDDQKEVSEEYLSLYNDVDSMLKEINERNTTLERKLKRTRRIGIGGAVLGFIVGILAVLII